MMETTEKTKRETTICFAYFGDGKFLGWYADTGGSIREFSPKVYGYSEKQVGIITRNFRNKLSRLNEESNLKELREGLSVLDSSLNDDKTNLKQYKEVELRIVECPEYDGENPDFDKVAYKKRYEDLRKKMEEEGVYDLPARSIERKNAIEEFNRKNPEPKNDSWIYADYDKVKEWAKNEPTVFIGTVTA